MHVMVYPHVMELGGSQLNAIELAAAVRDIGHEVTVYGGDGDLVDYVHELRLPYVRVESGRSRPSPKVSRGMRRLIRDRQVDVVHAYEWPPMFESFGAQLLSRRVAAVGTVMSMGVAPFIPSTVPLAVGTREILEGTRGRRRGPTTLMEPPVDTRSNHPEFDPSAFRAAYPCPPETLQVVIVSRLAHELKLEGILTAIRAVDQLRREGEVVRLVVVGDGPAREPVRRLAAEVNRTHGDLVIVLTGAMRDPRGAYAAADVCIGMGGSALRSLSFAKPLVVQGELGYFRTLTRESADEFLHSGWYGLGTSDDPGEAQLNLLAALRPLLDQPARRRELGTFGRDLVCSRFSLEAAARRQVEAYQAALRDRPSTIALAKDAVVSAVGLIRYKVGAKLADLRGRAMSDDFNARRS